MTVTAATLPALISHCKEYGFIFPSSEIYDGLSAVYDYGQNGTELKRAIRDYWWAAMTRMHDNIVGIDAAIFMHPSVWKASGHVDNFSDPMIDNRDSQKRYRVDHLIEGYVDSLGDEKQGQEIIARMEALLGADDFAGLKGLIEELKITCGVSGTGNWTDVRQFNLMFSTEMGSVADGADKVYLRPETAQGIFVNFLNVQKTGRMKIPFGIAQTGKAFRNEIVARQFTFRMREFEQMEMQYFVRPGEQAKWYEYWKDARIAWHRSLGIPESSYRFHDHVKLAHYADAACDIEFEFPFGFKEVEGIHSRTDFDLKAHAELSGKKLTYFDTEINQHYIPYVIETSIGLDRAVLMVLSHSFKEEDLSTEGKPDSRSVLALPPFLAPTKLAVLPLTKKDGLPEIARELMDSCRRDFRCFYEEKDSIGKRYRRMDALGTPFCVTIDHQTKEDGTVTLRHRDSMQQDRIPLAQVREIVGKAVAMPL
jgi:glycyl-tRNA synthetase